MPTVPGEVVPGPPAVGIFLVPGAALQGNLETMLMDAILAAHPTFAQCLGEFSHCIGAPGEWDINKASKRQVNALIAAYCVDDPASSLAYVWNKQHPVPLNSPRFDELVDFLQAVRGYA